MSGTYESRILNVSGSGAGGSVTGSGNVVLVAGTVTVSDTSVNAGSRIILSIVVPGTNVGSLYVRSGSITPSTSFIIDSTNGSDTSTVSYLVIN